VVRIESAVGPTIINRSDQYRVGIVDANLVDRPLGDVVSDIQARLDAVEQSLPDGYWIEFKGEFEDMRETFEQLVLALALAVLLVYMVMASQFESLVHPFIIMTTMPLAIIGVLAILMLTGKTLSVVSFVGLIILAGIVVNNGIVLIDYVNQLRREGMEVREALIEGGATRIRPILITAGTTIVGMLPMAISHSEGSELRGPMALTVIGGLLTSTVLTLYILPIVYQYIDRFGEWVKVHIKRSIH
jgi:HAE1 family hydrophobic/amphiphilic exporter-1